MLRSLSIKRETAGAVRYALSHWRALTRFVEDDELEIDNRWPERALRSIALALKNYLFMGSDSGGKRRIALLVCVYTAPGPVAKWKIGLSTRWITSGQ